jgi:hypothetical protein
MALTVVVAFSRREILGRACANMAQSGAHKNFSNFPIFAGCLPEFAL